MDVIFFTFRKLRLRKITTVVGQYLQITTGRNERVIKPRDACLLLRRESVSVGASSCHHRFVQSLVVTLFRMLMT